MTMMLIPITAHGGRFLQCYRGFQVFYRENIQIEEREDSFLLERMDTGVRRGGGQGFGTT